MDFGGNINVLYKCFREKREREERTAFKSIFFN
jgi:hypothetical protein